MKKLHLFCIVTCALSSPLFSSDQAADKNDPTPVIREGYLHLDSSDDEPDDSAAATHTAEFRKQKALDTIFTQHKDLAHASALLDAIDKDPLATAIRNFPVKVPRLKTMLTGADEEVLDGSGSFEFHLATLLNVVASRKPTSKSIDRKTVNLACQHRITEYLLNDSTGNLVYDNLNIHIIKRQNKMIKLTLALHKESSGNDDKKSAS